MIRSIATAAEEQSATSEQINANTMDINQLSKQTTDDLNQAALELQKVAELSEMLKELVAEFDTGAPALH